MAGSNKNRYVAVIYFLSALLFCAGYFLDNDWRWLVNLGGLVGMAFGALVQFMCERRDGTENKVADISSRGTVEVNNDIKSYVCPECNDQMERGYVLSDHSVRWSGDEKRGSFTLTRAESLTPGSTTHLKNPKCSGLRCRRCGLIIFKEWAPQ